MEPKADAPYIVSHTTKGVPHSWRDEQFSVWRDALIRARQLTASPTTGEVWITNDLDGSSDRRK